MNHVAAITSKENPRKETGSDEKPVQRPNSLGHGLIALAFLAAGGFFLTLAVVSGLGFLLTLFGIKAGSWREHPVFLFIFGPLILFGIISVIVGVSHRARYLKESLSKGSVPRAEFDRKSVKAEFLKRLEARYEKR